jgi:hypothetical protein
VEGKHTKKQSKAFHKKFFHYAGMTMPPDQDSNGQSTKDWPRFVPVMLYVDKIIDAPTGGGGWPKPSEARAKERVIIGCYDETLAPLIKASLERACAANWASNEDIDVQIAFTEEDLNSMLLTEPGQTLGNN